MERYREYRDKNDNIIIKADGNNAVSNVIEVVDPDCLLKVGDSVSDFSSNKDYLDDVYDGHFIEISNSKVVESSAGRMFEEKVRMSNEDFNNWRREAVRLGIHIVEDDGLYLCYFNTNPVKHFGTYDPDNEVLMCDDVSLFGHCITSSHKSIKSSLTTAVNEAEDYFGTIAEDNTILCQDIVTEKDKIEMKKLAEKNNVNVKLGQYSVTFYEDSDYKDTWNTMLKKDVE